MIDDDDCGAVGGMRIGRRNRSIQRKRTPEPLCPPQIPHEQTRARTPAVAAGSQLLTARAKARPTKTLEKTESVFEVGTVCIVLTMKWRRRKREACNVRPQYQKFSKYVK
jgi:hypothetical protein